MASVVQIAPPDAIRRIQRVQTLTIAWMSVEAVVSLFAAWRARSPALLAFGGDSTIELFSALVVLWRFRATAAHEDAERRAARVAGALLFALAAFVAITSVASLLGYSEPKPTFLGIAILIAAAAVMPTKKSTPEATIRDIEDKWEASVMQHDPSVPQAYLADDFRGVSSKGKVMN